MNNSKGTILTFSQTYCVDYQVPESGCTATAFLSGIKTNYGVLSMSAHSADCNCSRECEFNNHADSIFKFAQEASKATGIVTNARITHATPAGLLDFHTAALSDLQDVINSQLFTQNPLQDSGNMIRRCLKVAETLPTN